MALLVTLLVVTLLVTLILGLDFAIRQDLRAVGNFRDDIKASYIAKSGVAAARAILKEDSKCCVNFDALTETWATPIPPYPLGDGLIVAEIVDEGGKFNLNDLVNTSGKVVPLKEQQLKRLIELLEIDTRLVDGIVDWIDPDDEETLYGAEKGYYANLERPYRCKNGYLGHLSELHQIKGITDEIYKRVSPYLTVYPTPKEGVVQRININTADTIVLQSLSDQINPELAERIVEARPFKQAQGLREVSGMPEPLYSKLREFYDVRSNFFSIRSHGIVNGMRKNIHAVVERKGQASVIRYWRVG
jgi:general secretion pathway protein K